MLQPETGRKKYRAGGGQLRSCWVWSSGQLFRPRKSFGIPGCSRGLVWNLGGDVRLALRRLQLDVHVAPTALRAAAGSIWRAPRGHHQHCDLERGFLRNGDRHRRQRLLGAFSVGDRRGADIPGQFKSNRLLVPANERSLATAMFDSAAKFSSAIGIPILGVLLFYFGWRWNLPRRDSSAFSISRCSMLFIEIRARTNC